MVNVKDAWMPIKEAAEILNVSPEEVELLINRDMIADIGNSGGKLVNPEKVKEHIQKVLNIINKICPLKKAIQIKITGKEASKRMGIPYEAFIDLCENGTIKARRKAKGWQVDKNDLQEFIDTHQNLIKSLEIKKSKRGKPPEPPEDNPPPGGGNDPAKGSGGNPPNNPEGDKDMKRYSIEVKHFNGRGDFCRIDCIAQVLHFSEATIKKWITAKEVVAFEENEHSKIVWYVGFKSLQEFVKKYKIILNDPVQK